MVETVENSFPQITTSFQLFGLGLLLSIFVIVVGLAFFAVLFHLTNSGKSGKKQHRRAQRSRTKQGKILANKDAIIGWAIPAIIVICGGVLIAGSNLVGLALIGAAIIYCSTYFKSAQSPDVFRVFAFDRMIGKANAGWYMQIPGFFILDRVEMTWHEYYFEDDSLYVTHEGKEEPVTIKGYGQFRPLSSKTALKKMLFMPPEEMKKQAQQMAITRSHHALSKKTRQEAIQGLGDLEEELKATKLPSEYGQHGYEAGDFELNIEIPTVHVEATGRARGRAADSLAKPLRNNYPAALVSAVTVAADTLRDTVKSSAKISRSNNSPNSDAETLGSRIGEALDQVGGKRLGDAIDNLGGNQ